MQNSPFAFHKSNTTDHPRQKPLGALIFLYNLLRYELQRPLIPRGDTNILKKPDEAALDFLSE